MHNFTHSAFSNRVRRSRIAIFLFVVLSGITWLSFWGQASPYNPHGNDPQQSNLPGSKVLFTSYKRWNSSRTKSAQEPTKTALSTIDKSATPWVQTSGPNGGIIRAFAATSGSIFVGTSGGGVFRTIDNGANWIPVNNGLSIRHVAALAISGTYLFAGTGDGIFRSSDNGANWLGMSNGLISRNVFALTVSGATLFAGTEHRVFRSTDNGETWVPIFDRGAHALALISNALFVTGGSGIFRTTNNGVNWTPVNNGLGSGGIYSLAVSGTTLFAGVDGGGIFRTSDNGTNWAPSNAG